MESLECELSTDLYFEGGWNSEVKCFVGDVMIHCYASFSVIKKQLSVLSDSRLVNEMLGVELLMDCSSRAARWLLASFKKLALWL